MFCKNCGFDAGQNKFCPNCGAEIAAEPVQNEAPQPDYGATAQNTYTPDPAYTAPVYNAVPVGPVEDFNLFTAYASLWKKYATFSGRSRRKEYWLALLAHTIITTILSTLSSAFASADMMNAFVDGYNSAGGSQLAYTTASTGGLGVIGTLASVVYIIYALATLIPLLAMEIRRLHDMGKCGWFCLLDLIPCVGPIILLVFLCKDSQPGMNQYGPNPKGY